MKVKVIRRIQVSLTENETHLLKTLCAEKRDALQNASFTKGREPQYHVDTIKLCDGLVVALSEATAPAS